MDFDLSEEQRLLRESVDRLLLDRYTFDKRKGYMAEPDGWSSALWSQYAELGLLGLPFAEQHGGFGGGGIELMLVMEAFGRVLALEPYLATIVLAGTALRLAGSEAQQSALVPRIAAGELVLAFAHSERQARYDLSDVLTTAKPKAGGWVIDGAKSVVAHVDSAGLLVVSARTAGSRDDADGITLFIVDPATQGVARRSYTLRDGTRAAELAFCETKRAAWPTPTLTIAILWARSLASGSSTIIAASIAMLRPCSNDTNISVARCCSAWFWPIGRPNWVRVFKYSSVIACIVSIAPTASAAVAAIPASTTRSMTGNPAPTVPSTASAPSSTPLNASSAARVPSRNV